MSFWIGMAAGTFVGIGLVIGMTYLVEWVVNYDE